MDLEQVSNLPMVDLGSNVGNEDRSWTQVFECLVMILEAWLAIRQHKVFHIVHQHLSSHI